MIQNVEIDTILQERCGSKHKIYWVVTTVSTVFGNHNSYFGCRIHYSGGKVGSSFGREVYIARDESIAVGSFSIVGKRE